MLQGGRRLHVPLAVAMGLDVAELHRFLGTNLEPRILIFQIGSGAYSATDCPLATPSSKFLDDGRAHVIANLDRDELLPFALVLVPETSWTVPDATASAEASVCLEVARRGPSWPGKPNSFAPPLQIPNRRGERMGSRCKRVGYVSRLQNGLRLEPME